MFLERLDTTMEPGLPEPKKTLTKLNKNYICCPFRLEEVSKIKEMLDIYKPKYIINCATIST
jgi:hypothetical protein